ncbi:hypothetical protein V6N13_035651 [Hibiscus sabdariffa]|uniref:Uncharacterized protein n=1 Tax=Hibiscus sabdariffa TaxID=183260 RepID=A0ABR2S8Q0_9ROSI
MFAYRLTGTKELDVDIVEAVGGEFLDGNGAILEGNGLLGGAFGGEELKGTIKKITVGGEELKGTIKKITVGEDGEEFLADSSGYAYDGDGWA